MKYARLQPCSRARDGIRCGLEIRRVSDRHFRSRLHGSQMQARIYALVLHQIIEEVHQVPLEIVDLASSDKAVHSRAQILTAPKIERLISDLHCGLLLTDGVEAT